MRSVLRSLLCRLVGRVADVVESRLSKEDEDEDGACSVVLGVFMDGTPDIRVVPEYDFPWIGLSGEERVCAHVLVLAQEENGDQAEA